MERGLIQKATNYNESGTEVSETNYTYQRTGAPLAITAFKFDDNNGLKAYAKYTTFAATSELISTQTQKVFDSPTLTQARQSSVSYTYAGTNHKLPTKTQVTNSDNSILTTQVKYAKDYTTATAGGDAPTAAIYHLQQLNINIPVERYQQVQRGGQTNTISSALTKFGTFTPGINTFYLPAQSLKLIAPDGIANFQPSAITSGVFSWDSRYFATANYTVYDGEAVLQTGDDAHQHVSGLINASGTHQPLVAIKNGTAAEVSFNNFDNIFDNSRAFTVAGNTGGGFTANGSHTGQAIGLGTSQWLNAQVFKSTQSDNCIFSIWLNTATAGNLTIALTTSGSQTSTYTKAIAGNGQWTYYEWKIPVSNMTPTFMVKVSSSVNVSVDDVIFYPESAEVSIASYDATTHYKNSATNTNGVSVYYANDQWGRTLYTFDQDRNIVQKNSYILPADIQNFNIGFSVSPTGNIYNTTLVSFSTTGVGSCYGAGVTYQWNFGDGTAPFNTTQSGEVTHTYATPVSSATTYTVTLTASSPFYGQKTTTKTVTVLPPPPVTLTYSTNTIAGGISTVTLSNSAHTYNFTVGQLNGASIAAGTYNVTIITVGGTYNPSTGKGWAYVGYGEVGSSGTCFAYSSSGSTTGYSSSFNVIAGHTINFITDNASYG
jgi:hypothetical protein